MPQYTCTTICILRYLHVSYHSMLINAYVWKTEMNVFFNIIEYSRPSVCNNSWSIATDASTILALGSRHCLFSKYIWQVVNQGHLLTDNPRQCWPFQQYKKVNVDCWGEKSCTRMWMKIICNNFYLWFDSLNVILTVLSEI